MSRIDVSAQWGTFDDQAVVSNGTIAVGVNAYGHLGALLNPDDNWWGGNGNVGITHLASGTDLLADNGSPVDCVRITGDWYGSGFTECYNEFVGGRVGMELVSFTHTASEATSVIRSGPATVTQRFHPSGNSNAYQLDVTIRLEPCPQGETCNDNVRYRRIMPVWAGDHDEYGNPVGEISDYVTWAHDPAQTDVLGYTNLADEVSTEAGEIATLPEPASVSTLGWLYDGCQGFAIDLSIVGDTTGNSSIPPQATLYLGAAPTNEAPGVMSSIGARTYGLITPIEEANAAGITVFLAH